MIITITDATGKIVAEVIDPELVTISNHSFAVHENPDSEKLGYRVTEPVTGYSIAEGPTKKEAIEAAKARISSFEKSSPGVDIIKQQIFLIASDKIQSALTEVMKYVRIKLQAAEDSDE